MRWNMDGRMILRLVLFFLLVGFAQISFIRSLWKSHELGSADTRPDQTEK